jgi:hypothetical protein
VRRTFDMDGAAANFPDINFVIFQLTEQAKRKILGGNLARLHGMDVGGS